VLRCHSCIIYECLRLISCEGHGLLDFLFSCSLVVIKTTKHSTWSMPRWQMACNDLEFLSKILRSIWGLIPHCKSTGVAKALACLEGLKMVLGNCSHILIFESVCAVVVEAFNKPTLDRSDVGLIALELWSFG
jgi:hypothetical protein